MYSLNQTTTWKNVYDDYAAMMYGTILKISGDKNIAATIFEEAFLNINYKNIHYEDRAYVCFCLLRHTCIFTLQYLELHELSVAVMPLFISSGYPLLKLLYSENLTISQAAVILKINDTEARKKLHDEFTMLYKKHEQQSLFVNSLTDYCGPESSAN